MNWPVIIIVIAFSAFIAYLLFFRKKNITIDKRVNRIKDRRTLPSGLQIWVEEGANITLPEITAIEAGMQECFERAALKGYQRPIRLSDYNVAILGDCLWRNGAYVFTMPMPPEYAGSVYDDGSGLLYIAGRYIERDDINLIVLPDYDGEHLDVLKTVADNEAQHVILRHSNYPEYIRTKIHTPETPHPLF